MPRSTDIRKYGEEWFEVSERITQAYQLQGIVKFPFADREEATRRRFEIYSWIKALRNEVARRKKADHGEHAAALARYQRAPVGDPPIAPWGQMERWITALSSMVYTIKGNAVIALPTGETESSKSWRSAVDNAESSVDALARSLSGAPTPTPAPPEPDLSTGSPYDDIFKDDK